MNGDQNVLSGTAPAVDPGFCQGTSGTGSDSCFRVGGWHLAAVVIDLGRGPGLLATVALSMPVMLHAAGAGLAAVRGRSLNGCRALRSNWERSLLCGTTFWRRVPLFVHDRPGVRWSRQAAGWEVRHDAAARYHWHHQDHPVLRRATDVLDRMAGADLG